jgi:uncharacterized protein YecT (DUF1311 family)
VLALKDTKAAHGRRWLIGLAALALAPAVAAAPAPQEANAAYDAADVRLNAAYKKLSRSLDDAGRKDLRDEERQWLVGRDTSCRVSAGTVVKNECTTTQTSFRADELEKRLTGSTKTEAGGGPASLAGEWAYRSDCNFGHDAEINVQKTSPQVEGTWTDGTRNSGSQGQFKGESRDGKVFVRFCAEDSAESGYPACPAYSDVAGYLTREGNKLAWYRTYGTPAEGEFDKYVVLGRKAKGGNVPKDLQCKDVKFHAASGASTQDAKLFRPAFYACVKASGGVTAALNGCIGTEHDFQDNRLNAAYQKLRKAMTDAQRTKLRDEERAWIEARDKDCAPDKSGGTGSMLDSIQCDLREIAQRAAILEARITR